MDYEQQVTKRNGKVVVQLLTRTDKRTVDELTDTIHHYSQLSKRQIKTQLKDILQKGVEGGFLSKHGNEYSVDPDQLQAAPQPMDNTDQDPDFDEEGEDRRRSASRRRRARARKRSRSRSRRRRR